MIQGKNNFQHEKNERFQFDFDRKRKRKVIREFLHSWLEHETNIMSFEFSSQTEQRIKAVNPSISSCHMMPQQPLHPCMFPLSSKRSTTHCLTNPYDFQIGDIRCEETRSCFVRRKLFRFFSRFLGTSGQNIDDIDLQSTFDDRLDILENCLKWGVIAPTCPDTLSKKIKRLVSVSFFK